MAANATQTTSAAQSGVQPKLIENGAIALSFSKNFGATKFGTTSDMILLAKIPHGCTIHSAAVDFFTKSDTAVVVELIAITGSTVATQAVARTVTFSGTGGIATIRGGGAQVLISCSDNDTVRHGWLALNVNSGTETVSVSIAGHVLYSRDGNQN